MRLALQAARAASHAAPADADVHMLCAMVLRLAEHQQREGWGHADDGEVDEDDSDDWDEEGRWAWSRHMCAECLASSLQAGRVSS